MAVPNAERFKDKPRTAAKAEPRTAEDIRRDIQAEVEARHTMDPDAVLLSKARVRTLSDELDALGLES